MSFEWSGHVFVVIRQNFAVYPQNSFGGGVCKKAREWLKMTKKLSKTDLFDTGIA